MMGRLEEYEREKFFKVIFTETGARLHGYYGPVVGVLDEFDYGSKALTPMLLFTLVALNKPSLRRDAVSSGIRSVSASSPHYARASSSPAASP